MEINFNFNVRQNVQLSDELKAFIKETLMSELSDLNQQMSSVIDAAVQRITEDFDALRAKVEAGTVTAEDLDAYRANIARIAAIDPDPDNPPVEPTPEPEPEPDQPA
jgi:hypothetical protein